MPIDRKPGWKRARVDAAAALTVFAGCGGGTAGPAPNASAGDSASSSGSGAASARESVAPVPKQSGSVTALRDLAIPAGSTTVSVPVSSGSTALAAGGFRMLALHGGLRDGTRLQANFLSCPSRPAGQRCQQ